MVELNITEIDNLAGSNEQNIKTNTKKTKKSVTYEDIFTTLNMHVVNGKIQIGRPNPNVDNNYQQPYWEQTSYERYQPEYPQTFQQQQQQYTKQIRYAGGGGGGAGAGCGRGVGTSRQPHIAALLQQQAAQQQQQQPVQPLTRDQALLLKKQTFLRQQAERNHINQIKSTKLFFSATSNLTSNANHNLNKLFRLNGR